MIDGFPQDVRVVPTFNLPQNYLKLYLNFGDYVIANCNEPGRILLTTGKPVTLVDQWTYDYCAVVANQAGSVGGFTIGWASSPWPEPCCKISASPSQLTIPAGRKSSAIVTLTSQGGFGGNISFTYGITHVSGGSLTFPLNATFSPPNITLKPGSSNSTTIIVTAFAGNTPEVDRITISAYPEGVDPFDFPGTRMELTVNIT
jgi:hypothetical protein